MHNVMDVTGLTNSCYIVRCFTFQDDRKKKKKERVKPVPLSVSEQSHVIEVLSVPANHLEEIHPKGDQQLKQKGAVSLAASNACIDLGSQIQIICGQNRF
jgi:hypothetical protein